MPNKIGGSLLPHPAVLILLWLCLIISMQSLKSTGLLSVGFFLLIVACALSASRLITLLRRTRWIMLSMLIIYAYATLGEAVWVSLAQYSPTHGLINGILQLSRLTFNLAGLSILLSLLTRQQLIGGLYVLTHPLRYVGLSRERLALNLALTLQYAESAIWDSTTNWRARIGQMLAPAKEVTLDSIELHTSSFTIHDYIILTLGCTLFVLVLL